MVCTTCGTSDNFYFLVGHRVLCHWCFEKRYGSIEMNTIAKRDRIRKKIVNEKIKEIITEG